jgi:hypothetical protein
MRVPQRVSTSANLFVIPAQAGTHEQPRRRHRQRHGFAVAKTGPKAASAHCVAGAEHKLVVGPGLRRDDECRGFGADLSRRPVAVKQLVAWLRHSFAVLIVALMAVAYFSTTPAHAQSCTIDAQCSGGGRSVAMCMGDMLTVKSARCIGGSCQEREERRQSCGPAASQAISCQGNIAVRSGGGCDPIGQSCSVRTDRDVCVKSCACVKNRLIVATGQCVSGAGCARATIQCQNGCTCSGEPRCL